MTSDCTHYQCGLCQQSTLSGCEVPSVADCEECEIRRPTGRGPCLYLGPRRRCCNSLHLCRRLPGESCTLSQPLDGALCCEQCDLWEPSGTDYSGVQQETSP